MAQDARMALVEELNRYTPCFLSNTPTKKEEDNYVRLIFLVKKVWDVSLHFSSEQQIIIRECVTYSAEMHRGQRRKNKVTPYHLHLFEVAYILISAGILDFSLLCASILHDTVENTKATRDALRKKFGAPIAKIVHLLTKDPKESKEKYWLKMLNSQDLHAVWRVILIKFADRIHNASTFDTMSLDHIRGKVIEVLYWFPKLYEKAKKVLQKLEVLRKKRNRRKSAFKSKPVVKRRRVDFLNDLKKKLDSAVAPYITA